jgi:hypothetical protein
VKTYAGKDTSRFLVGSSAPINIMTNYCKSVTVEKRNDQPTVPYTKNDKMADDSMKNHPLLFVVELINFGKPAFASHRACGDYIIDSEDHYRRFGGRFNSVGLYPERVYHV